MTEEPESKLLHKVHGCLYPEGARTQIQMGRMRNEHVAGEFSQEQLQKLLYAFKPVVAAVDLLSERVQSLEAAAKEQGHTARVTQERKDKGPPQVGG